MNEALAVDSSASAHQQRFKKLRADSASGCGVSGQYYQLKMRHSVLLTQYIY